MLFISTALYSTYKETGNMTEAEMKLTLLLYNMLSKERAVAAYRCEHTDADECIRHGNEWSDYTIDMVWMRDDLRKCGYRFAFVDYKTTGKVQYEVYKIVPIDKNSPPAL